MPDYSFEERLRALSNTSRGLGFIQTMLDRGDFPDPVERRKVEAWLKSETKRRTRAYLRTPEGSAIRQADYARTAIWISIAALAVSLAALWVSLR